MSNFSASWLAAAAEILQAEFSSPVDLLPGAAISGASFSLTVDVAGDWGGTFTVAVDELAMAKLLAEVESARACGAVAEPDPEPERVPDPDAVEAAREEWQRLFRRICIAAAQEFGVKSGNACEVAMISPGDAPEGAVGMGYQLLAAGAMAALLLSDAIERAAPEPVRPSPAAANVPVAGAAQDGAAQGGFRGDSGQAGGPFVPGVAAAEREAATALQGLELWRDVELEASLRFGSREIALSELLALGPGDVIQLDRALTDLVDLIIGDKIVARGEVVLVNGNFGLQVVEVAEPKKTLESIRCLF